MTTEITEKLCFIDIETTGVNREIHEIHQISGIIVINNIIRETFDYKIRPSEKCVYDSEALEINNLTIDDLQSPKRLSHQKAYQLFSNMLQKYVNKFDKKDKFFFVGYNAHFDKDRIYDWFMYNGDKYFFSFFWGNHIDVMVLATIKLMTKRPQLENFQLTTVCKALNLTIPEDTKLPDGTSITEKQAHDAIYDILITKALFDFVKTGNVPANLVEVPGISDLGAAFLPAATASITKDIDIKKPIGKSGYPVLDWDSSFPFKKYRNHTVKEIFDVDVQYLKWCIDNTSIEFTQEVHDDIELYYTQEMKKKCAGASSRSDSTADYFFDNPDALSYNCSF